MLADIYLFMLKIVLRSALVMAHALSWVGLSRESWLICEWVKKESQHAKHL
jgi:hypothetical protein